jgi:hypothetical protein
MKLYDDAAVQVPAPLATFHASEGASFVAAGTWLTGEERSAVVRYARQARATAGLAKAANDVGPAPESVLPQALLDFVAVLAVAPQRFTRDVYAQALSAGITDVEYDEVVGLVSRVVNLDVFAHGLGAAPCTLPAADDVEPTFERPAGAVDDGAWVPTLPTGPAGGDAGKALYGDNMQPFIYRALSLVPSEARSIIEGGNLQYLTLDHFFDFDYSLYPELSRSQVELIAGRVSAFNECFY